MVFSTQAEEGLYNLCFHACPNYKERDSFNLEFDVKICFSIFPLFQPFLNRNKLKIRWTLKRITKETICLLVKCPYLLCIQWCRCCSSFPVCFGYSFYGRASECLTVEASSIQFHITQLNPQAHRFQDTLHYGSARIPEIFVVDVPFDQLPFHQNSRRTRRGLGHPILHHAFVSDAGGIFVCVSFSIWKFLICKTQTEGSSAVYNNCPDWNRMDIHQTHYCRQGQESVHDCHSIAGKLSLSLETQIFWDF